MRRRPLSLLTFAFVALLMALSGFQNTLVESFVDLTILQHRTHAIALNMGLYDTPLPPRPSPRDDSSKPPRRSGNEEDDDDDEPDAISRLFTMTREGTEARGLLPPLRRKLLDYGIGCYFETTDRLVQNLAEKTQCHPEDAAWALEACQGDITEAWTYISVARRTLLSQGVAFPDKVVGVDWDAELVDLMETPDDDEMLRPIDKETYQTIKAKQLKKERQDAMKRDVEDLFGGGKPDQPWLPKDNPRPVDDEPWFTG